MFKQTSKWIIWSAVAIFFSMLASPAISAIIDADLLDGYSSEDFAVVNHNHDKRYPGMTHNHDKRYLRLTDTDDFVKKEGDSMEGDTDNAAILSVKNTGRGDGLHGISSARNGYGVYGSNLFQGYGVYGESLIRGFGVAGFSPNGTGVRGSTNIGIGVHARSIETTGFALRADGRSRFSTAGTGLIGTGQSSATVTNFAVTPSNVVLVTLNGNPGAGNSLQYVSRTTGSFTVNLEAAATGTTSFSYLIAN